MNFVLILCSLLSLGFAEMATTDLKFKSGPRLKVEVARSFSERSQGLMNRTKLAQDQGMLFIFDQPQKLSFWMKDTFIPLSIAYLDANKTVKEIHQMKAQKMMEKNQDLSGYPSQCLCQYALEVNQGWFKKNKIKVGDQVTFTLPAN